MKRKTYLLSLCETHSITKKYRCVLPALFLLATCWARAQQPAYIEWSTFFGGRIGSDRVFDVIVEDGMTYVLGTTSSPDFPVTAGAAQPTFGGGSGDYTLTKFDANGQVVYSTFWGGSDSEGDDPQIQLAADGSVYLAGWTISPDFPVTAGAAQPTYGGGETIR